MSATEYKSLNELMRNGWSYFVRGSGSGPGAGVYCWEKYEDVDGALNFISFVVADSRNAFPSDDYVDGFYYKRCFDESNTSYTVSVGDTKVNASLVSEEIVDGNKVKQIELTESLGDADPSKVLKGTTFTSDTGLKQVGTLEVTEGGLNISVRIDDQTYPIGNVTDMVEQDDGSYTLRIN